MKKILIALLALLLCLSFVACGEDPAVTTPSEGGDDTVTTDGTGSAGDNETKPAETKPAETKEPEVVDSDTLSVGEDNNTEFGPINQ